MSKDPAILFYTGDFLNGCTDLTFDERGQYITLLCLQHQKGHLSEKTIRLTVGSVSVDVLKKFIKDGEGNYYNDRMEEEIAKRQHFLDTRYFNGKKGGRPIKPNSKPNSKPTGNLPINRNENENIVEEENKKRGRIKFIPPTVDEVILYFTENGYTDDAGRKAFNYYSLADWHDSRGNKIKNWKQKMNGVWFKEENKPKEEIKRVDGYPL
jgi:uncharacterized protein YdaU (DUF1376 family)